MIYIANFFNSRSNGIDDFYTFIDLKKDEPKNSGGGGGNPPKRNKLEVKIEDKLTNKCAKEILERLPNLKNEIAELLDETFGGRSKFDVIFVEGSLPKNVDGTATSIENEKVTITLSKDMLKTATKEYILATMYHEVIHAFLSVEREKLGERRFKFKYPNVYMYNAVGIVNGKAYSKFQFLIHDPKINGGNHFQFGKFIDKLAGAVISFNPEIPLNTALALVKVGIVRGSESFDWEIQLNQNEREGKNHQGTKCK